MAVNGGAGDDGPPLTELESLQLKANQVTDDSLESTRRMIQEKLLIVTLVTVTQYRASWLQ